MPFIAGCSEPLLKDVQPRRGDAKSSGGIIGRNCPGNKQSGDRAALLFGVGLFGSGISYA